jgi:uncharacterized protein YbaR (Trm112 family)
MERYRTYDGVLWLAAGWYAMGGVRVAGPLCPDDRSTLSYIDARSSNAQPRAVRDEDFVGGPYGMLVCPGCKRPYSLGGQTKRVEQVRGEVERVFAGDLRRVRDL